MKQWFSRLGKTGKIAITALGVAIVSVAAVALVLILGDKEESYRNIRVNEVQGTVLIHRNGEEGLEVYENMNLLSGDEIVTGKGAKVTLCLDDDKFIVMEEESKMTLHAAGTAEDSKTTLNLEYGVVFSDIKNKLSADSEYNVVTPSSTMAVRGTQFEVIYRMFYDEDGNVLGKQMQVFVYEGLVYIELVGSGESRLLKAGDMVNIIQTGENYYVFDGEEREIVLKDLRDFNALYLRESLGYGKAEMTEEEKLIRERLVLLVEEYFAEAEEVLSPTATPEPAPTPSPTATPESTPVPSPTATPEPAPTPSPTATPEPTATPSPTATPVPSPTATPVPSPTATPEPMPTPSPTATPVPSPTATPVPSPTATPIPSPTATPTPSPTATPTPSPSPSPTPHVHSEDAGEVTTEATCVSEGVRIFHCSTCGEMTRTESIPVDTNAHVWIVDVVVEEATCTEIGTQQDVCDVCGETKNVVTLEALGHLLVQDEELSAEATEEADGLVVKKCTRTDCEYTEETVLHYGNGMWELVEETEDGWQYFEHYCGTDPLPEGVSLVQFCQPCMDQEGAMIVAIQKPASEWVAIEERETFDAATPGETETIYHLCPDEITHVYRIAYSGEEEITLSAAGRACIYYDHMCDLTKHVLSYTEEGEMYCETCGSVVDAFNDADGMLVRDWCSLYGHQYDLITSYTDFTFDCEQSVWNVNCTVCYDEDAIKQVPVTSENIPADCSEEMRVALLGGMSHEIRSFTLCYVPDGETEAVTLPLENGSRVAITEAELNGAVLTGECGNSCQSNYCGYKEEYTATTERTLFEFFMVDESGAGYIFRGLEE